MTYLERGPPFGGYGDAFDSEYTDGTLHILSIYCPVDQPARLQYLPYNTLCRVTQNEIYLI